MNYPYGDGDSWRRQQLTEFLEERSAPRQQQIQDSEIKPQNEVTLIDDLLFKILISLPAESLFRSQFVCKKWFDLINSSIFIRSHAQQSETVLICRKLTLSERPASYFHFMDLDAGGNTFIESRSNELYDILASRDGLILARYGDRKKLMIVNPITRKQALLPTLNSSTGHIILESFGIAFSKTYKVVRLFSTSFRCTGCDILCISTRKWRRIEEPPYELLRGMYDAPISVGESLYWTRRPCHYYVSMNLNEESFVSRNFPVGCSAYWDKLVEIEGGLGFVHHARVDLLQVWMLMDEGGSRENWVKRYSFSLGVDVKYYSPICSLRNGKEIVMECPNFELCVYNLDRGEMKVVHSRCDEEAWGGWIQKHHIPHRNTLVSCT